MEIGMRDIVVYVGSIMLPDNNAAAQRALSLSKSFRNLGYKVVIVGREKENHKERPILSTKSICQGFDTYALPQPVSIKQWMYHTISAKEFIQVIEHYGSDRIKCVVVMEYEAVPLAKLARYCGKHEIPLIADNLEWFGRSQRKFPENLVKDIDTWMRMHFVYPLFVKNMICISRFLQKHYQKTIKNCVYIPGTIDAVEEKWNGFEYHPNDVLTLCYAGSLGRGFEKERVDFLVQAVSELNQEGNPCRLLLVGIDEAFVKQYEQLWKAVIQSDGMIECKGRLPHREAIKLMASCDFSVIVRENKRVTNAGFPTKLSESFGCGTPVLTTRTSNIAEYIPSRQWGVVSDGYDIDAIKNMIKHAMEYSASELSEMHAMIKHENPLRYELFDRDLNALLSDLR